MNPRGPRIRHSSSSSWLSAVSPVGPGSSADRSAWPRSHPPCAGHIPMLARGGGPHIIRPASSEADAAPLRREAPVRWAVAQRAGRGGPARELHESRMWRRPGSRSVSLVATRPGRFGLLAVLLAAMGCFGSGGAGRRGRHGEPDHVLRAGPVRGGPVGGLAPGVRGRLRHPARCGTRATRGKARPSCSSRWTGTPPPTWPPTRPGSGCPASPARCRTSAREPKVPAKATWTSRWRTRSRPTPPWST